MVGISVKIFVTIILIFNYQLFQLFPHRPSQTSTYLALLSTNNVIITIIVVVISCIRVTINHIVNRQLSVYFRTTFSDKHVSRTALNERPPEPPLLSKLQKRRQERNGKSNRLSKFVNLTTAAMSEIKPPKLAMIAYV